MNDFGGSGDGGEEREREEVRSDDDDVKLMESREDFERKKKKTNENKNKDCKRCQPKAIATVFKVMSQEKKDIVEETRFGALAHVPEMNTSHSLLRELIDCYDDYNGCLKTLHRKIYITPDKWDWANHVLTFLRKGIENRRKGKKQSVNGCVFVLMLIYFHESKFPRLDAADAPGPPWVAHWTLKMMLDRISQEATDTMGLLYRAQLREEKTKEKKVEKKTIFLKEEEKGKRKKEKKRRLLLWILLRKKTVFLNLNPNLNP
ncbi:hypothetical protein AHAS_Ahas12G0157100 [Arachis hypogaea]